MKAFTFFSLILGLCAMVHGSSLSAKTPSTAEIINRARATLGTEKALDGVVTLQMLGSLESADPKVPGATVFIVARKPLSQRLEIRVDDLVETTILNGKQACLIRSNLKADQSQMRKLTGPELERVLHSTRQFFNFYRPDFKHGEKVSYEGIENYREQRAHKVKYAYPDGLETIRFFSVEEDHLLGVITENGVESVNQGSQIVEGIKYPESIDYYEKGRRLHTIRFTRINVNDPLAAGIFNIPSADKK